MVFDEVRNRAYAKAIRAAVNDESVVLDLGAGLGIHGLVAAGAGARKVILVEPDEILHVAGQVAEDNGLSRPIELIHSRIETATLSEPASIIISVFTGNFLLTEDLLSSLFLARDRFLKPQGVLIPDAGTMEIVPVSAPAYHAHEISTWSRRSQGVRYCKARPYAANSIYYGSTETFEPEFLAQAAELLRIDFNTAADGGCHRRIELTVEREGTCHGWLGWSNIRLGTEWLSNAPGEHPTHWSQAFFSIDPPVELAAGNKVVFELLRPREGEWSWTMEYGSIRQRHSTFLSIPISTNTLIKKSATYRPHLSQSGLVARFVLDQFDGATPVSRIIDAVIENFPNRCASRSEAERLVERLVSRFA